jgi:hypothetical protein
MKVHRFIRKPGSKNNIFNISIATRVVTSGAATTLAKTGLAYTDITKAGYVREGAAADVAITPAEGTLGTFVSGGFVEVDATNCPGVYQICIPDAAFVRGAKEVVIALTFAASTVAEDQLIHVDLIRAIAY